MDYKVSVIIPVYRAEPYLRECMDSVLGQSLRETEVIAVDDGSPDGCGAMLDEYGRRYPNLTVIHQPNAGVSAARNAGMAISRGEYLYIMDADDYLEKNALETLYRRARETDADVVIADHFLFSADHPEQQRESHFFQKEFLETDRERNRELVNMVLYPTFSPYPTPENTGLGLAAPWTRLVRRALTEEHQLRFDPRVRGIFDDGLFAMEVFARAERVAYIRYCAYHYRVLETSLMRGFNPQRAEINEIVFERIREFGGREGRTERFEAARRARVLLFLRYAFTASVFNTRLEATDGERKALYRRILRTESYREAAKNADRRMLRRNEKLLARMVRSRLAADIYFAFRIRKTRAG